MEPIYPCPLCQGPIALWAIRSTFACHHCHWVLSSNVHATLSRALVIAGALELLLFTGLYAAMGSLSIALGVVLAAGCLLGLGGGWLYARLALRLTALHPPRR